MRCQQTVLRKDCDPISNNKLNPDIDEVSEQELSKFTLATKVLIFKHHPTAAVCRSLKTKFSNYRLKTDVKEWVDVDSSDAEALYSHISDWDVSGVTDMIMLFMNATTFKADLSRWDVINVVTFAKMFAGTERLSKSFISHWKVSNKFTSAWRLRKAVKDWIEDDLSDDLTTEMRTKASLIYGDIAIWNVDEVKNMKDLFKTPEEDGRTLSMLLLIKNYIDVVKVLVEEWKTDVNDIVIELGHLPLVEWLQDRGEMSKAEEERAKRQKHENDALSEMQRQAIQRQMDSRANNNTRMIERLMEWEFDRNNVNTFKITLLILGTGESGKPRCSNSSRVLTKDLPRASSWFMPNPFKKIFLSS